MNIILNFKLEPKNYEIIKQKEIIDKNDHLIIGIYKPNIFKEDHYIICCNRLLAGRKDTLDYTRYSKNIDFAYKIFDEVLKEVNEDLERS